jgi:hypothetical protein
VGNIGTRAQAGDGIAPDKLTLGLVYYSRTGRESANVAPETQELSLLQPAAERAERLVEAASEAGIGGRGRRNGWHGECVQRSAGGDCGVANDARHSAS